MLVLALNLVGDQDLFDAVWRALLAGIVVNVVVWRCAIVVWRTSSSPSCARRRTRAERARERRGAAAERAEHRPATIRRGPSAEPIYPVGRREAGVRSVRRSSASGCCRPRSARRRAAGASRRASSGRLTSKPPAAQELRAAPITPPEATWSRFGIAQSPDQQGVLIMGLRIQNNVEAFNTHRQLTAHGARPLKSMEKLSSGYRINRAADDAAGLAISEKMRGQIGGLAQAQRNAQDGISLVQTAEGALNEVHSMLQRVRDLKVQYDNGTLDTDDKDAIAAEVAAARHRDQRHHAPRPQFNGIKLLDGTGARSRFQVGANDGETIDLAATRCLGTVGTAAPAVSTRSWHGVGATPPALVHGARSSVDNIDDGDQERLERRVPTSARCRTASSTA